MPDPTLDTTDLLHAWAGGDRTALDRLAPRVYDELRGMAKNFMRFERAGRTIQATALVHEAFIRLVDTDHDDFEQRSHFFAVCAQVMRRILLEGARRRATAKRGGGLERIAFEGIDVAASRSNQLLALDEALTRLGAADPRKAQVVELRYFGGLSVAETAAALKVSADTVARDWRSARAWLQSEIVDRSETG